MNHPNRIELLRIWLTSQLKQSFDLHALPHDASFRRYHRIVLSSGETFIAMDSLPDLEPVQPFCAVQAILKSKGLIVPDIYHACMEQGFLVLSDFGDTTYLKRLTSMNADELYAGAFDALLLLHEPTPEATRLLPSFDSQMVWMEWEGFSDWFVDRLLHLPNCKNRPELVQIVTLLAEVVQNQPQVVMHRDYHAGNLMYLPGECQPGILDFQSAFIGPVTYDPVSLLRDCYIDWPETKTLAWLNDYRMKLNDLGHAYSQAEFTYWFDLVGIERHLKALFTFARKAIRDEQPQYLQYVPRTLKYLKCASSHYPELSALHHFIRHDVTPAFLDYTACVP